LKPTIVIWGAGRIGRGFVADLFSTQYHIVFIDQSEKLVESLRKRGQYTVVSASGTDRQDRLITGYDVLSTSQEDAVAQALAVADLVAVAVFPRDFPAVVEQMLPGLLQRHSRLPDTPLDIILCTNLLHAAPVFQEYLSRSLPKEARSWAETQVGLSESLVIRMVSEPPAEELARDPLLVWTNGYSEFPVDYHAFKGKVPTTPGLRLVEDMRAEEMRKLYTYNTFHAALAYFGAMRGHDRIVDCMADLAVLTDAEAALDESSRALMCEYGYTDAEMICWKAKVISQTDNPALGDTVARYGNDPTRKLRRSDRLVGPLLLARKHHIQTPHLERALAAALLYQNPQDEGAKHLQEHVTALGLNGAIGGLCEFLKSEEDIVQRIVEAYAQLKTVAHWSNLARRASDQAFEYEKTYHGCGQCTLAALLDTLEGFDPCTQEAVFEAATGFAGGMGLSGDAACGALSGATMAFGLLYPRRRTNFGGDRDNKYRTYAMAQRLRQRYLETYGSIICHDIHRKILGRPYDLRDPSEREEFAAAGAHEDKCTMVVSRTVQWAVEIIAEEETARS
jgi:mannitol-1-phosphate 5-dehydrogenase